MTIFSQKYESCYMIRSNFLLIFVLNYIIIPYLSGACPNISEPVRSNLIKQDTLQENQILFNGRLWRNFYYMVKEDQFLFSKEFLSGSLTINDKTFTNVKIKYDIYNDEILTPIDPGGIMQLNKEMVDSFSVSFQNKTYQFIKIKEDSLKGLEGYFNVIYKGKTALYVKYSKKIDRSAIEGKYDTFYPLTRIYFLRDGIFHQIGSKKDLFKVLNSRKTQIKDFIKKNKLRVSKNVPESFIPVVRFYDNINR